MRSLVTTKKLFAEIQQEAEKFKIDFIEFKGSSTAS